VPQLSLAVAEQGKIIDIAHIGGTAQIAFDEVIKRVEVARILSTSQSRSSSGIT